ncbi:MAG: DUF3891 family protein, partial [Actinomycetota bacterium]
MIVQTAPEGADHFVVRMADHTAVAGAMAAEFGNDRFAQLEPADLMTTVVTHHDAGWDELDGRVLQNPETGLPYHLVSTPLEEMVKTSGLSPEANEARHPYCGIISSMHSYGLYHGRYGLSDKLFIDLLPEDLLPEVTEMLTGEERRQERIRAELSADDATAGWVTEEALFHNYKALQLFDTLALYLQCETPGSRGTAEFPNVPTGAGEEDVTITATELDADTVRLDPYPFAT